MPTRGHHRVRAESVGASWREQPWSIRVLRAFLGVTFVYAGIQKFADPNFFHAGTPDYIGSQLQSFARGSPLASVLGVAEYMPVLTGMCVALAEIAVGAGTLLGIGAVTSAAGGLLISITLWLSATWHVHPYFLGSDSMYAVAWLAFLAAIFESQHRRGRAKRRPAAAMPDGFGRRELLRGGALAALSVLVGSAARAFAGPDSPPTPFARSARSSGRAGAAAGGKPGQRPARGKVITSLDRLPVGDAVSFTAPGMGPAALVRTSQDEVVAFSRVCTHAGCLVGYDTSTRILICPCHGAEFDPTRQGAPIAGPAATPLAPVDVTIDKATGQVILPS